jgi:AraC-like DNA-binding protein
MPFGLPSYRSCSLRGYQTNVVNTAREAYELSERNFTRLEDFRFESPLECRLVSSGARLGSWSVRLVHSTGHRISLCDDDKVSLLFPYFGAIGVGNARISEIARPSEMIVAGPGFRDTTLSRQYLGALIQVPVEAALKLDLALCDRAARGFWQGRIVRLTTPAASAKAHLLIEALERKQTQLDATESWVELIRPLWEALSLAAVGGRGVIEPPASMAQVLTAEEFMVAHSSQSLSLLDVARTVGVGARALQLAFMRHRRYSPLQFLQSHRLRQASLHLGQLGLSVSITDVALDAGFTHLSRFSEAYRKAFGEYPSQTQRRARP